MFVVSWRLLTSISEILQNSHSFELSHIFACFPLGIVTKMLQPILPVFFVIQFNFLYDGWKNNSKIDWKATLGFATLGAAILLAGGALEEVGLGLGLLGLEGLGLEEGVKDVVKEEKVLEQGIGQFFK